MPLASVDSSLAVHLLAGLPTEAVTAGFARAGDATKVLRLDELADADLGDASRIAVLLPPFAEPSVIVESWEACEFLPTRFGRPAHVAGVTTFLDTARVGEQLASTATLASLGWGRSELDRRTVADILVGQIESATHLALVGDHRMSESLGRCLAVLNPEATRARCSDGPDPSLLATALGLDGAGARSARVLPRWLEVLRGERDAEGDDDLFVYRRARPFDERRLLEWLADPPGELLRGKGQVWLSSEPDRIFGYSCAGSVHRLFPAGRWWASATDGGWPSCPEQRKWLLERWHPRFGDRRQELVFVGIDLDADRLSAQLDRFLLDEESIGLGWNDAGASGLATTAMPGASLH